jgi:hypothetical protein
LLNDLTVVLNCFSRLIPGIEWCRHSFKLIEMMIELPHSTLLLFDLQLQPTNIAVR